MISSQQSGPAADAEIGNKLERMDDHLRQGLPLTARALGRAFVETYPENVDGWILLGRAYLALNDNSALMQCAERAVAISSKHPAALLLLGESLLRAGRIEEALASIRKLEKERKFDPAVLQQIGYAYTRTNRHADAARCYERVSVLKPADHQVVHNLAGAYIALGQIEQAEKVFDDLLRKFPHEYDAYYNRSQLRKQKPDSNHIAEMEKLLAELPPKSLAEPVICYSLAKELEDLQEYKRSFAYLKRGADAYSAQSDYRVEQDIEFMAQIKAKFDGAFFTNPPVGYDGACPIFVLGMARSGTTLVDRILSSHSSVESVGESYEFTRAIARHTGREGAMDFIDVAKTSDIDWEAAGRDVSVALNGLAPGCPHPLDKTPKNFYYLGLILAALPNAKIVHLRRNPVDNCYAVYKVLFRQGYPFSYNLENMGRAYLAYRDLMAHWRQVLPGRFLDVDYEELVAHQEEQTRRIIGFCDLPWEDACLSFEKNESPSLTASAAQVRQPIYKTSVALWRRYEEELQPLIKVLRDGGVEVD